MSRVIRAESDWIEMFNNEDTRANWAARAKDRKLTGVDTADGVWISDALIDAKTTTELKEYAAILEGVPVRQKDWHLENQSRVLNLVDPSLFPLIYDCSWLCRPANTSSPAEFPSLFDKWREALTNTEDEELGYYLPAPRYCDEKCHSEKFCWLPSEFCVDNNGAVTIESYINNLHPVRHAALYTIIASVFSRFIPLLEQVLTDLVHPREPRVVPELEEVLVKKRSGLQNYYYQSDKSEPGTECQVFAEYETYLASMDSIFDPPQPEPFVTPARPKRPYKLSGRRLQAIVKMSNIELTPDQPVHCACNWRMAGLANERVIAIGILFYDVVSITRSVLQFREALSLQDFEGSTYEKDSIFAVYGVDSSHFELSQKVGEVDIKDNLCLTFPNTYQHSTSPLELADKTKPGHFKMLTFYVVDPSMRIPSTETVPPQQKDWWIEDVLASEPLRSLPHLVVDGIMAKVDYPVSLKHAKWIRLEKECERIMRYMRTGSRGSDCLSPSTLRLVKSLEIELDERAIYSGKALRMLLCAPYEGYAFPLARKLLLTLIWDKYDGSDELGEYADIDPLVAKASLSAFVERIKFIAPMVSDICVQPGAHSLETSGIASHHFGDLVSQLYRLADCVEYHCRDNSHLLEEVRFDGIHTLVCIVYIGEGLGHQFIKLARWSAPTLQSLTITTVNDEVPVSGLIRNVDGSCVIFPCLLKLKLSIRSDNDGSTLLDSSGPAQLPCLRRLDLHIYCKIDMYVFFKGNEATLEFLDLTLDTSMVSMHDTLDVENSRSDEVAGDLFGDDSGDELAENSEMAAIAAMPKIPKRNRAANASASYSRRDSESDGVDRPTETNVASEPEEAAPAPVDPKQAELDEINRKIDAALKSGRARRRKRTDEDDANIDEMIVELRKRMRDAAYRDIDDNKDRLPAIHKLSMLPDVIEELSKPPLYEAFLDNNIVESIRLWLEPLDDGSLPSLDIQNAMLESLGKLPIRRDHLRESGIGKIILFMSKCPRISEQNRHICEQFVQQWSRMVLRLSADYRDRRVKEASVASDTRHLPAARSVVAGATRAPGGIQVESGSGKGAERATARIPQRVAANYNVMPVTSLSLSDNSPTPNRTANKYKRLMQVMHKGGRR
ncbi:hypothetical protein GGI19_002338 [Coemansia pectinata]|uniref:TFIIS N-terminal domain-containing protein n=1 Tax=Coemansia pectinata TaxID=1052879 RepID=A0A9W8H2W9_9FUNG|nr:hypothetical protein GGI19_002338 [Coemansia pectinata]